MRPGLGLLHAVAAEREVALPEPSQAEPSLALLVAQARRGQRAAQQELYERHVAAVFGYCRAFARDDVQLAEDLCQEAFATALAHLDDLREPERFSGWLKVIARRTCLRWAERRRTEQRTLDGLEHEPSPAPSDEDRAVRVAARLIAACPDDGQRRAAELFYRDPPHSTAEIGRLLGVSRTAVTTRLHRFRTWARGHLLAQLADSLEEAP